MKELDRYARRSPGPILSLLHVTHLLGRVLRLDQAAVSRPPTDIVSYAGEPASRSRDRGGGYQTAMVGK